MLENELEEVQQRIESLKFSVKELDKFLRNRMSSEFIEAFKSYIESIDRNCDFGLGLLNIIRTRSKEDISSFLLVFQATREIFHIRKN